MGADPSPGARPAGAGIEQRAARRVALLFRAAKLVSRHGEFLCILRDASSGGIKVRLFHELPLTRRFALELVNGESLAVRLVWQREGHAGLRFVERSVAVRDLIEEPADFPRRTIRLDMSLPVWLVCEAEPREAVLRNLSQSGARIETEPGLAIGQRVWVGGAGLPELAARVRWRRFKAHGLVFERGFRLDELAVLAARLQQLSAAPD